MEPKPLAESEASDMIRELAQINADSSAGFETAANVIDSGVFAELLRRVGDLRQRHAVELSRMLEDDDEVGGSFGGQMHRWWLSLRGRIQGGEAHMVLAEVERGEDEIKERYEKLLLENPGSEVGDILRRHLAEIVEHHDLFRDLRDYEKRRAEK